MAVRVLTGLSPPCGFFSIAESFNLWVITHAAGISSAPSVKGGVGQDTSLILRKTPMLWCNLPTLLCFRKKWCLSKQKHIFTEVDRVLKNMTCITCIYFDVVWLLDCITAHFHDRSRITFSHMKNNSSKNTKYHHEILSKQSSDVVDMLEHNCETLRSLSTLLCKWVQFCNPLHIMQNNPLLTRVK